MEVVWKVCALIIKNRLWSVITLHDAFHGFRQGRGTGMANTDVKLSQQLSRILNKPLFHFFLDVPKTYGSLDRER